MSDPEDSGKQDPVDPMIGRTMERYRIEREIGRGGMGVVYQALQIDLGRKVAVKTISPHALSDADARARFIREAKALGRVQAQGLVDIYTVGEFPDGAPYIVMEYLEGPTLRERQQQSPHGRLSVDAALALTGQLASTLAELHAKGVIHRDIKPDNIKLVADPIGPDGERTKLLDLGIAKLLEEGSRNTQTMGTPLYMAPECCAGQPLDGQADVYSLGCVLYELLCGRPPYLDDGGNVMAKHLFQTPQSPRAWVPSLPRGVSEFVLTLLAQQPADRPSAQQVYARAQRLLENTHTSTWVWFWLGRHLRKRRIGLRIASAASMVAVLILLVLVLAPDAVIPYVPASWCYRLPWTREVRIPGQRFVMGSSRDEIQVVRDMAAELDRLRPKDKQSYARLYAESGYLERQAVTRTVELPAFRIDRFETTNEEFVRFLNDQLAAGRIQVKDECPGDQHADLRIPGYPCVYLTRTQAPYKSLYNNPRYGGIRFKEGRFVVDPLFRRRPVVAVSFQAAIDFCVAQGKRLPTEAEWEYVARRGDRRFPWGADVPSCQHAVLERCGEDGLFCSCAPPPGAATLPDVGSHPLDRTLDGVYDLAGSVSEWTSDYFVAQLPSTTDVLRSPRQDPPETASLPILRVLRGGAWNQDRLAGRGAARFRANEQRLLAEVGFRCVREMQ